LAGFLHVTVKMWVPSRTANGNLRNDP
jgi:hypothetical protein